MVVIVDYGMGNLKSVANACQLLGKPAQASSLKNVISKADKIILPGVGHFGRAVEELKKSKIFSLLIEKIKEGVPFFGICLGMQLLFEESEEAAGVKGLSVLGGKVRRFKPKNLLVPHMGWNQIRYKSPAHQRTSAPEIFRGVKDKEFFYFVHSYYCQPEDKSIIATVTDYGIRFASSLNKDNIWAVQFHAEKSQEAGLKVLGNFLKI